MLAVVAERLAVLPSASDVAEKPKRPFADTEIRRAVVRKLRNQPRVDSFDITVAVKDGVDSVFEHGQAADAASRVNGVIALDNKIWLSTARRPIV